MPAWASAAFAEYVQWRDSVFEEEERACLLPLPPERHETCEWRSAKVAPDYAGCWPNAVERGGKWRHLALEQHGIALIEGDCSRDGCRLVIDGEAVTFEEFGKMMGDYEGFELEWRIRDVGDSDFPDAL